MSLLGLVVFTFLCQTFFPQIGQFILTPPSYSLIINPKKAKRQDKTKFCRLNYPHGICRSGLLPLLFDDTQKPRRDPFLPLMQEIIWSTSCSVKPLKQDSSPDFSMIML